MINDKLYKKKSIELTSNHFFKGTCFFIEDISNNEINLLNKKNKNIKVNIREMGCKKQNEIEVGLPLKSIINCNLLEMNVLFGTSPDFKKKLSYYRLKLSILKKTNAIFNLINYKQKISKFSIEKNLNKIKKILRIKNSKFVSFKEKIFSNPFTSIPDQICGYSYIKEDLYQNLELMYLAFYLKTHLENENNIIIKEEDAKKVLKILKKTIFTQEEFSYNSSHNLKIKTDKLTEIIEYISFDKDKNLTKNCLDLLEIKYDL